MATSSLCTTQKLVNLINEFGDVDNSLQANKGEQEKLQNNFKTPIKPKSIKLKHNIPELTLDSAIFDPDQVDSSRKSGDNWNK